MYREYVRVWVVMKVKGRGYIQKILKCGKTLSKVITKKWQL